MSGKNFKCEEVISNSVKSAEWTKSVVYKVYCNDDLNELPKSILEDMRDYIIEIINSK